MFAMERQRLAMQEKEVALNCLIPGLGPPSAGAAGPAQSAAPPKVPATTFVVKKAAGYKPKPKAVQATTLLNPLAEEDKAKAAEAAARAQAEAAAAAEQAQQARDAPQGKGGRTKGKRARGTEQAEDKAAAPKGEEAKKAKAALGALLGGDDSGDSGSDSEFDPYA